MGIGVLSPASMDLDLRPKRRESRHKHRDPSLGPCGLEPRHRGLEYRHGVSSHSLVGPWLGRRGSRHKYRHRGS